MNFIGHTSFAVGSLIDGYRLATEEGFGLVEFSTNMTFNVVGMMGTTGFAVSVGYYAFDAVCEKCAAKAVRATITGGKNFITYGGKLSQMPGYIQP